WFVLHTVLARAGHAQLAWAAMQAWPTAAMPLIVAGIAWFSWRVWKGRLSYQAGCLAALALFLLVNKVYSLQYALWVIPLFAIAEAPWWSVILFLVGDVAVFWTLWPFLKVYVAAPAYQSVELTSAYVAPEIGILVRAAGLALLVVMALAPVTSRPSPSATG
ncbi:MAG: hypothetical protein ACYDBQ_04475, partial [Thermoplasmatota archaeon]